MRLPLLLVCSWLWKLTSASDPRTYENTAVVRSIDLGGSLTYVTTTFAIRALGTGSTPYYFALSEDEQIKTTWVDAKIKGELNSLSIDSFGFNARSHTYLYSVDLPPLPDNGTTTLVVSTIQSHASKPFPATAAQGEPQALKYETEIFVLSPYTTIVQRTKMRAPSPKIYSYTVAEDLSKYLSGDAGSPASKAASVITYGPFHNIPPSNNLQFLQSDQQKASVHYEYDHPVLTVVKLKRSAEVSHWGANLNIQDEIMLRNDGPALKGHFSRLAHQHQSFYKKEDAQSVRAITLNLPAGIIDPYYYDLIGNVSTSRFRPAPISKRGGPERFSHLELKPRYPLLGGWNYSFTLGWDAPLAHSVSYDAKNGTYILAVPFLTPIPGAAVDEAEVKVILPEAAEILSIHEPFQADKIDRQTHVTYLDTIGRPAIVFSATGLTEKHNGVIYVEYQVPIMAHLQKPLAVASVTLGLFALALVARRIDTRIYVDQKKAS